VKVQFGLAVELQALINSYDVEQEIEMYREIGMIPGVLELLAGLRSRGLKTALATSASRHRMQSVIEMFDLAILFDAVVCDEDVKLSKPDPEIFITAAEKLDVMPENCVVIEDSRNGLIAAKKAGMFCIGFKGLPHVTEDVEEADEIIGSFDGMSRNKILRLLNGGAIYVND
jgi:HAD superfamily hydrolase (TIGR01509 family)